MKRLRIGHPIPPIAGQYRLSCDVGQYSINGSISRNDYQITAERGTYNLTGQEASFVVSGGAGLTWPTHSPSYIPVLPGHGGYGMDTPGGTGRHLGTPATTIILVDSLAATNTGNARPELGLNVYSGTFEYAWRHSASPKVIVPIISGWTNYGASIPMQTGTPPRPGYVSYWGQFAPTAGLWLRGTRPHLNGASNAVIMHMRSYIGDDATGLGADNRDPFGSGYGGGTTSYVVLINNEFGFSVDELCDFFRPHTTVSWLYNVFGPPLHRNPYVIHNGDPVGTDHGFGPLMGGDTIQPGSFTDYRNVYAHSTGRNPATTATSYAAANNLHYNHGRPGGGNGEAIDIWVTGATAPMLANVLGNGFVRGPENTSTIVGVRVRSGAPAGTMGYLAGNAAGGGWTAANQFSFVNTGVGTWQQTSLVSGAFPNSWGTEVNSYLRWASSASPSTAEWHAFIDLMDESCGACPGNRVANTPVEVIFDQIRDRINGGSLTAQFVDTTEEWTGNADRNDPYWPVTSTLINPTNPGTAWHAPLPVGDGRDTPYTTGTFSNGLSRVGRSPLEVWAIEQHWYRGGK